MPRSSWSAIIYDYISCRLLDTFLAALVWVYSTRIVTEEVLHITIQTLFGSVLDKTTTQDWRLQMSTWLANPNQIPWAKLFS